MKISELSTIEIKALLYDSSLERDRVLHNIKMLQEELNKRQEGQVVQVEAAEEQEDAV